MVEVGAARDPIVVNIFEAVDERASRQCDDVLVGERVWGDEPGFQSANVRVMSVKLRCEFDWTLSPVTLTVDAT